jgi:hypothetical protein
MQQIAQLVPVPFLPEGTRQRKWEAHTGSAAAASTLTLSKVCVLGMNLECFLWTWHAISLMQKLCHHTSIAKCSKKKTMNWIRKYLSSKTPSGTLPFQQAITIVSQGTNWNACNNYLQEINSNSRWISSLAFLLLGINLCSEKMYLTSMIKEDWACKEEVTTKVSQQENFHAKLKFNQQI